MSLSVIIFDKRSRKEEVTSLSQRSVCHEILEAVGTLWPRPPLPGWNLGAGGAVGDQGSLNPGGGKRESVGDPANRGD